MPSVSNKYRKSNAASASSSEQTGAACAPVVLMVSGGADSTALLVMALTSELDIQDGCGLARIDPARLHVLHVNHQLRGAAADEDEAYVRELCQRFSVPVTVERVDVAARAAASVQDSNVENVARQVRYEAANRLANELCAATGLPRSVARIVTAHTANDRAETFFMNAIKGSGMQGLASIPHRRNRIVRPLLGYTHQELCDLLVHHGISWREDATNADTHYLRAYVRHEIVPRAEERNPRLLESIATTCDILSDEDAYLTQVAARAFRTLELRSQEGICVLDAARLSAAELVVARRVVRMAVGRVEPACRLDAAHVEEILKLVAAGFGSITLPEAVSARVSGGMLTLATQNKLQEPLTSGWLEVPALGSNPNTTTVAHPGKTGYIQLASCTLTARLREVAPGSDPVALAQAHAREWEGASVLLDAEAAGLGVLGGKLWIEAPQAGEILCPLGMHGQSKKLSDLLIDSKIPLAERNFVPVVHTQPNGQIVWVAPIRVDERARVTAASRVLLELHFRSENFGGSKAHPSLW